MHYQRLRCECPGHWLGKSADQLPGQFLKTVAVELVEHVRPSSERGDEHGVHDLPIFPWAVAHRVRLKSLA